MKNGRQEIMRSLKMVTLLILKIYMLPLISLEVKQESFQVVLSIITINIGKTSNWSRVFDGNFKSSYRARS